MEKIVFLLFIFKLKKRTFAVNKIHVPSKKIRYKAFQYNDCYLGGMILISKSYQVSRSYKGIQLKFTFDFFTQQQIEKTQELWAATEIGEQACTFKVRFSVHFAKDIRFGLLGQIGHTKFCVFKGSQKMTQLYSLLFQLGSLSDTKENIPE